MIAAGVADGRATPEAIVSRKSESFFECDIVELFRRSTKLRRKATCTILGSHSRGLQVVPSRDASSTGYDCGRVTIAAWPPSRTHQCRRVRVFRPTMESKLNRLRDGWEPSGRSPQMRRHR